MVAALLDYKFDSKNKYTLLMTLNSLAQIVDMLETFKKMLLTDNDWGVGLLVAKTWKGSQEFTGV